ncbi:MAG: response regulator [Chitinophagaceae bacterium]|nr:response regulator [Chitinophagaceae bacterium]
MSEVSILIAEDDADDRFLMQTALKETRAGEKIQFVENGIELLSFLNDLPEVDGETKFPRFILLDLNMPKMDGREALKKIKSSNTLRKIPVIVFSTTKSDVEVKRCYELGANTYVVKPVSFDSLVNTIGDICDYWFQTATLPGVN